MYRTTELANFAGLANSTIFMKLTILVIIVFGVLTGLIYGSASPFSVTSPSPPRRRHSSKPNATIRNPIGFS